MTDLCCPVCGKKLEKKEKALACAEGHSFDLAKSGYVNLLRSSSSGHHGDDKAMVRARTAFLDKGWYRPLAECVAELCAAAQARTVVDAGCGEGYYTAMVAERLPQAEIIGLDISKAAVDAAAKRCRGVHFAAAGCSDMPLPDGCADVVLNIFSPLFPEEYARVLRPGGMLLRVVPLERHLHGLRELVYERPYDNPPPETEIPGFVLQTRKDLCYTLHLSGSEEIMALFRMTPYYYKTGREDQEKAERAERLTTEIEFGVLVYRKA